MTQCTKIKVNNEQCKAHALNGEKYCLFHLTNERGEEARKVKILSKEKMIKILQKEIRKLKKEVKDPIARSSEIRRNLQLIMMLKGEKLSSGERDSESEDSIKKKLEKWREKEEQKKK